MLSVASLLQGTAPGGVGRARRSLAAREDDRRRVSAAMQELPEAMRVALALRFFESARPRQIAVVLGIPEERIEGFLSEAVRTVTEILQRPEGDPPEAVVPRSRRVSARRSAGS